MLVIKHDTANLENCSMKPLGNINENKAKKDEKTDNTKYETDITREEAMELLKKYNKEEFHIRHGITVEQIMRYFARKYNENENYWGIVGLLHDIDYEIYPDEHCQKVAEMLKEINATEQLIKSICSHAYGICTEIEPEHKMEKILFAIDELSGLIWAVTKMRPSKSSKDMELQSLKKKYKDKKFAAGCSREIIAKGAELLGWELDELLQNTLEAMQEVEDEIQSNFTKNCSL